MLLTYFDLLPYRTGDENLVLSTAPGVATTPGTVQMAAVPQPRQRGHGQHAASSRSEPGPVTISLLDATGRLVRAGGARQKAYPGRPAATAPAAGRRRRPASTSCGWNQTQGTRNEKLVVNH